MATATISGSAVKAKPVKKKRAKKKKNYYFHQGTEKAIIRYNKTDDPYLKNLIYNEHNDSKELYNLKEDPSEENNLIDTNLEIEKFLWDELQKLQT